RYWVEAYRAQGLRNVTDRARIEKLELVRVASDKWFDAITVRLYGAGLDYVVRDSDGKVMSGSTHRERKYTEYWTFIRGAGRTGPTRTAPECPSCGAPLSVGMAGDCRYCRAKVTTGEFDWVLSRIEQDEAYRG
ncbi:MAG TPA: TIM44-like domain-containing protein, partial [Polyangiaceae bacterium]